MGAFIIFFQTSEELTKSSSSSKRAALWFNLKHFLMQFRPKISSITPNLHLKYFTLTMKA